MTEKPTKMFLVISTDANFNSTVLQICDSFDSAVSYLTSQIDYQFEPDKSNKYRVVQKSKRMFEVYLNGYLGKYFYGKFSIAECDKPN